MLWNIDLTLVDVGRVTRAAYAEAFGQVTGRPLVQLPQMAGRTDSEIFFDALALNEAVPEPSGGAAEELLGRFTERLAVEFAARRALLTEHGRLLPGALEAVTAVGHLPGVVQTVLTGAIKPNAAEKLRAFGLTPFLDVEIGGYASEVYPKGATLVATRSRAARTYQVEFTDDTTVYIADSERDVAAAQAAGARCLAVASGRSSAGVLRAAGADAVLADLADTAAVVRAVERLTAAGDGVER